MTHLIRIFLICLSCSAMSPSANAMALDRGTAQTMKLRLYDLVETYILQLALAITEENIDILDDLVQAHSPWRAMLDDSAQSRKWGVPHFEGVKLTYSSYLWTSLMALSTCFDRNKSSIVINKVDQDLYDFTVDGARITVVFGQGQMKLYDFAVPSIAKNTANIQ